MHYKGKIVIGITGGIGSGKTRVLELLKNNYDVLVIEADKIGHKLQEPNEEVYKKIVKAFGTCILEDTESNDNVEIDTLVEKKADKEKADKEKTNKEKTNNIDKKIDRKKLGALVFADESKLKLLNSITHPAIHQYIEKLISGECNKKLIFVEAAILTETSLVNLTDLVWYIYSDIDVRIERLEKYRGISKERALNIITNQPAENDFRKKCDMVIDNSFSDENTLRQLKFAIKMIQEEYL